MNISQNFWTELSLIFTVLYAKEKYIQKEILKGSKQQKEWRAADVSWHGGKMGKWETVCHAQCSLLK